MGPLNRKVLELEKKLCAVFMSIMGTVVFLDVIHRVASRERGLLNRWFGDAPWVGVTGTLMAMVLNGLLVFAALRARGQPPGARTAGLAAGIMVGAYALLRVFLVVLPNGLVWSQTLGLVLMLWVGCIGASMAAAEHRHLALDLGSKLWPRKVLPYVQAVGHALTGGFCVVLALLSLVSLRSHFGDYVDTDGAGGTFAALPIPKWVAFTAIPVGFANMGIRFFAQMVDSLRGHVEEDDPLQLLGLKADPAPPPAAGQG